MQGHISKPSENGIFSVSCSPVSTPSPNLTSRLPLQHPWRQPPHWTSFRNYATYTYGCLQVRFRSDRSSVCLDWYCLQLIVLGCAGLVKGPWVYASFPRPANRGHHLGVPSVLSLPTLSCCPCRSRTRHCCRPTLGCVCLREASATSGAFEHSTCLSLLCSEPQDADMGAQIDFILTAAGRVPLKGQPQSAATDPLTRACPLTHSRRRTFRDC